MFRRIATVVDVSDAIGLAGLALLAAFLYVTDPRLLLLLAALVLIVIAIALAQPRTPAPPAGE